MAGTTNHLRQYTSNFYYPFRKYTPADTNISDPKDATRIIDFTASESAERNEIIVLPIVTNKVQASGESYTISSTPVTGTIDVYANMSLINSSNETVNNWVKISTIDITEGEMTSISPLFALQYVLIPSGGLDIYVANNAVSINGQIPYVISQTFPVEKYGNIIGKNDAEVITLKDSTTQQKTEAIDGYNSNGTMGLSSTDLVNKTLI